MRLIRRYILVDALHGNSTLWGGAGDEVSIWTLDFLAVSLGELRVLLGVLKTSFEQHSVIQNNYKIHSVLLIQSVTGTLQTENRMRNPDGSAVASDLVMRWVSELLQITLHPLKSGLEERAQGRSVR